MTSLTDSERVALVNTALYEAMEQGDHGALDRLWLDSAETEVSCVHPGWPVLRGRGEVLVVTDSTHDRFGSGGWQRSRCRRIAVAGGMLAPSGCRSLGTGKPSWLTPIRLAS